MDQRVSLEMIKLSSAQKTLSRSTLIISPRLLLERSMFLELMEEAMYILGDLDIMESLLKIMKGNQKPQFESIYLTDIVKM